MNHRAIANAGFAAGIGLLLVLPFVVLEYVFQVHNNPAAIDSNNLTGLGLLFGIMWLLPAVFTAVLVPLVRTVRAGGTFRANPVLMVLRVGLLVLIFWAWSALVLDQLPCFLGVPNCD